MAEFATAYDYIIFEQYVKNEFRHVLDVERQAFARSLIETSHGRVVHLPCGFRLWRSQLAHDEADSTLTLEDQNDPEIIIKRPIPCRHDRLVPLPDRAKEGRANPKGIPCIYLSEDRKTAITEQRPWMGSFVTLCKFVTKRRLSLVDLTTDAAPLLHPGDRPQSASEKERAVWWTINEAFSRPVTSDETTADYAPTQFIAEIFRSAGHDGLIFKSSLGLRKNYVLFDLDSVDLMLRELYKIEKVEIQYQLEGRRVIRNRYADERESAEDRILPPEAEPDSVC